MCNIIEPSLPTHASALPSQTTSRLPEFYRCGGHHRATPRTFPPSPALERDVRLLEDRLGQKTGCKCDNQDTGWVCQTPNYQARISANKATWLS